MNNVLKNRVIRIFKAMIYSYMVTVIFLLATAILVTYSDIGSNKERIIVTIGIIISTFLAGLDTARGEKRNGWKWGIFGSLVYAVIYIFIAVVFIKTKVNISINLAAILCVMMCSGAVGGMLGINIKKKQ